MDKKKLLNYGLMVLLGGFIIYEKFIANQQTTATPSASNMLSKPMMSNSTTYMGDTMDTSYGPAQVKIIMISGRITDVIFLQYPSDRSTSARKSQMAMSAIKQEVIRAQSANIDTVSGATETSYALIQSVASALAKVQ